MKRGSQKPGRGNGGGECEGEAGGLLGRSSQQAPLPTVWAGLVDLFFKQAAYSQVQLTVCDAV